MRASRAVVERALGDGKAYYGINTGFGILAQKRIEPSEVERLQTNLLRSHAVGLGSPVPKNVTRLMLRLKIHALALGYSGVAPETLARLALFAERDLIPAVPSRGSVGASGDLAPLAHMSLPLIGAGSFWDEAGRGPDTRGAGLEGPGALADHASGERWSGAHQRHPADERVRQLRLVSRFEPAQDRGRDCRLQHRSAQRQRRPLRRALS